jgi:uncharacterized membrane protein (DUF373 family)
MKHEKPKGKIYNFLTRAYYTIMIVMAFVVLVLLIVNVYMIVKSLPHAIFSESRIVIDELIAQILTFFVLIELTRAFTEYLEYRVVRLHIMAEIASIFILREILVKLYIGEYTWLNLIAFSVLLISVVVVRVMCLKVSK